MRAITLELVNSCLYDEEDVKYFDCGDKGCPNHDPNWGSTSSHVPASHCACVYVLVEK